MDKRKIAAVAVVVVIVAAVVAEFLTPYLLGKAVDFKINAVLAAQEEQRYALFFIDNVGHEPLDVNEIYMGDDKVFPGQSAGVSIDGGPMQPREQITLNAKETALVKIENSWSLGEEYNLRVSASAPEAALIPSVRVEQIVVKAPSTLKQGSLLSLGSLAASEEDDGSLSASLDIEAAGLDWVRVMLFTHFTASWPGYKPVKFYYDPVYTVYYNGTSNEFYSTTIPNTAIGSESDIMGYYGKVSGILSSAGIEVEMIDTFGLWNVMVEMQPAIVIMGTDILPKYGNPPVWYGEEDQQSLASRWLKYGGGVIIWIGDYLAYYYGEPKNGSRMYIPGEEAWRVNIARGRGDWWLLGYDAIEGGYINTPLGPTRAGKTLGLRTQYVDRSVRIKGERQGPALLTNTYFYGMFEETLKEWSWSTVTYLPAVNGTGGVWYIGVVESTPIRPREDVPWKRDVRARYPSWDDLVNDVAWDAAMAVIHSVWTGLTGQGGKDTGYAYFTTEKAYIAGELRLSTLPLDYPEGLDSLTVRVVAIGYDSETGQYFYDQKTASIPG